MSARSVDLIMNRILTATPESPIAVFRWDKEGLLDAVFACTVATQQRISANDPLLVGVYDKTDNVRTVKRALTRAVKVKED
jgi:hypothetical protein